MHLHTYWFSIWDTYVYAVQWGPKSVPANDLNKNLHGNSIPYGTFKKTWTSSLRVFGIGIPVSHKTFIRPSEVNNSTSITLSTREVDSFSQLHVIYVPFWKRSMGALEFVSFAKGVLYRKPLIIVARKMRERYYCYHHQIIKRWRSETLLLPPQTFLIPYGSSESRCTSWLFVKSLEFRACNEKNR